MPAQTAFTPKFARRRIAVLAIAALGVVAALAPATSANQTVVHAYVAKDGTTVVSGYDGGAALKP
jgi:hypothetical protein